MNYSDPTLADALAREYALGTLQGAARQRLQAVARENLIVRRAIQDWERRLAGLAGELTPVAPPEFVWPAIERAIGNAPVTAQHLPRRTGGLSAALAAVFALLAVTFAVLYFSDDQVAVTPDYIAVLNDGKQQPAWSVQAYTGDANLRIRSLAASVPPDGRVFELWMLPEDGSSPVSLGLITEDLTTVKLDARQIDVLIASSALAISEEPRGGSPTGVPTGDVLFVGSLAEG